MASSQDLREAAYQELLGSPVRESFIWSRSDDIRNPFEKYQRAQKLRGIGLRSCPAQLAEGAPFGPVLSARYILDRAPDDLLGSCESDEEAILLIAAILRTLQFFAGGEERHEYRLHLINRAEQQLPDLADRAPGVQQFAVSECRGVRDDWAEVALPVSREPTILHALAHLRLSSDWMSSVEFLVRGERTPISDPRVRHLVAHWLFADGEIGRVKFAEAVRRHFAGPASSGSLNSLIRDLVPLALLYEQRWGAGGADEFWTAAASIADRLPFGSEWLLTEACRVLAYRRVGRADGCETILSALEYASPRCADEPGWSDGVECVIALARSMHADSNVSNGLGGSRDQHQAIGSAMA